MIEADGKNISFFNFERRKITNKKYNEMERKMPVGDKLTYSLDEASKVTGLSKGHLRNQNKLKKLKFIKSGRRTLILAKHLNSYLESLSEVSD